MMKKGFYIVVASLLVTTCLISFANAQDIQDSTKVKKGNYFDTAGKIRFQVGISAGGGSEQIKVGEAYEQDDPDNKKDINISGGGGVGGIFSV